MVGHGAVRREEEEESVSSLLFADDVVHQTVISNNWLIMVQDGQSPVLRDRMDQ